MELLKDGMILLQASGHLFFLGFLSIALLGCVTEKSAKNKSETRK